MLRFPDILSSEASQCPTNPYLIMATSKSKKVQVLASRIKEKGEGEEVLSEFWDYTCEVKTAFLKSKVVQQEEELPRLNHLLTWGSKGVFKGRRR